MSNVTDINVVKTFIQNIDTFVQDNFKPWCDQVFCVGHHWYFQIGKSLAELLKFGQIICTFMTVKSVTMLNLGVIVATLVLSHRLFIKCKFNLILFSRYFNHWVIKGTLTLFYFPGS